MRQRCIAWIWHHSRRFRIWKIARDAQKPVEPWVIDYFNELERREEIARRKRA